MALGDLAAAEVAASVASAVVASAAAARAAAGKWETSDVRYLRRASIASNRSSHLRVRLPAEVLSIALVPGDDVEMEVEDVLLRLGPRATHHLGVAETEPVVVEIDHVLERRHDTEEVALRYVEEIGVVLLRGDERVVLADGVDVEKGVGDVGLLDLPRRSFPAYNLAEDAVLHSPDRAGEMGTTAFDVGYSATTDVC